MGGLLAKDRGGGTLNIAPDAVGDYVDTWPDVQRVQDRGERDPATEMSLGPAGQWSGRPEMA